MVASKAKSTKKKRLRHTAVIEEDILKDHVVDVDEEWEISWTESDKNLVGLKIHSEITKPSSQGFGSTKDPKTRKKEVGKTKRGDPAPTQGPGSLVKRQKLKKFLPGRRRSGCWKSKKC